MIVLGLAAVDNDVGDPTARRQEWKRRGRINRQGGAERYDEISPHGCIVGTLQLSWIETLSKTNCRRF